MKKFIPVLISLIILLSAPAVFAESALSFTPKDGEKFIYSSNPENITDQYLAESDNMLDNYGTLTPGRYTYMAWYHNGTPRRIFTDVLFNTLNQAEIRINRLGLQVFPLKNSPAWTGIQAYSDFLNQPIQNPIDADENNPSVYRPRRLNLPLDVGLGGSARSKWLSDIYQDVYGSSYPYMTNYNTPIYIIMEFDILSGTPSLSTIAYRTGSDKTSFIINGSPYVQDVEVSQSSSFSPSWKGMADSAPLVNADLSFEITPDIQSDSVSIPVTINGDFGENETSKWITNLNPQNDLFAFRDVPASSMLEFDYNDGFLWRFNTARTSLRFPPVGFSQDDFEPNSPLPDLSLPPGDEIPDGYFKGLKKQQISLSQGNYSVATAYTLTLTNKTDAVWKFNYRTDSGSGTVVGVSANGGETEYNCSGSLGMKARPRFVGPTIEVPPGETYTITVSVTLTTGDNGGITNEFYLSRKY